MTIIQVSSMPFTSSLAPCEEELILGLKQRDIASFEYLYDNYANALYKTILKVAPNTDLADDILQDAFIRIWSNIDNYDPAKARLFTWISHITKNVTIDVLKSKQGRNKSITCAFNDNLKDCLFFCNSVDIIDIRKQLNKLKRNYQVVIELAYFYDLSSEEISKLLNLPLGTIKTRRKLALGQLSGLYSVQSIN